MARKFQMLALSLSLLAGLGVATASPAQVAEPLGILADAPVEATAPDKQVVHSEAGRFSLAVPVDLQAETATSTIDGTRLTWTIAQANLGADLFAVAYTDLPLDVLALGQEAIIDTLREKPLVEQFDWSAIAQRGQRISQDGIPGIEFFHLTEGQASAVQFYLANRRLYAVMATSSSLHTVNQFLEAFAIDSLWRAFVSEAGGFTVDLPMAPVFTPQQTPFQGEMLNWWQYVGHNLYAPDDRYGFAFADLPAAVAVDDSTAFLETVADLVLTELDAPELADTGTVISLDGHAGRQYQVTYPNGRAYVLQLYLVDRRVYSLLAASQSLDHLDRFLTSFQVQ